MRKTLWALVLIAGIAAFVTYGLAAPEGSGYHLVKKIVLGGEGGWDYLNADPTTHRVYISRGTHIMVVDPEGNVVGDIANLKGTHGAALVPELNRGFSSNGQSNSVTIFDLKTLQVIKEVPLPMAQGPDGYLYDPASKRVFVFNARSQDGTGIDAKTGEVAGMVPVGGKPEAAVLIARDTSSSTTKTNLFWLSLIPKPSRCSTTGPSRAAIRPQVWQLTLRTSGCS